MIFTVNAKAVSEIKIALSNCVYLGNKDEKQELIKLISKFQMSTDKKGMIYTAFVKNGKSLPSVAKDFAGPIEEILTLKK